MYIHIGNDFVLKRDDIVGIFDLDNTTSSHITRTFLGRAETEGLVVSAAEDLPKAFIVTGDGRVYLSQLMTQTLLKRSAALGVD